MRISLSVSEGPFDFEITRVDCILYKGVIGAPETLQFKRPTKKAFLRQKSAELLIFVVQIW